ncbi:MAG: hypothetical protein ABW023_09155 [Sphingomonas sp.]
MAAIDAVGAATDKLHMKRIPPLLIIAACAALLVGGLLWKIGNVNECTEYGGIVVAPMTRNQHCASTR